MPPAPSRTGNPGCLVLAAVPFLAVGGAAFVLAARSLGDANPWNARIPAGVAGFVVLLAVLMLAAGVRARRSARAAAALRATHPGEPWRWRTDWAAGRADGEGGGTAAAAWTVAVLWNGVAVVPVWLAARGELAGGPAVAWIAIFPAVGVVLLAWAIRATARRARYGRTFLRLDTLPAPLGGTLRGTLSARLPPRPAHGVRLTLGCVNRVTSGSGRSRSTFEHVRWQDEHVVPAAELAPGPAGTTAVPVAFDIPRDQRATDGADPSNAIRWLLRARADVPGVDLDEVYEVPVFETAESPAPEAWAARVRAAERAAPPRPPPRPTIAVSRSPRGGTAFEFGPARNPGQAAGATLFLAAFGAVEVFLVRRGAPLVFPIVFGLFVALLAAIVARLWFGRSRAVAEGDRLSVEWRTLGVRRARTWSRDEVRGVGCRIGMQSGQGAQGVPYYDVVVADAVGRTTAIGTGLRDHEEAEWIARQLREALGVGPVAPGHDA